MTCDPLALSALITSLVNNYIEELYVRHQGVEMVNIHSIGRRHYTNQGMHLRELGKRLLANLIVDALSHCAPVSAPQHHSATATAATTPLPSSSTASPHRTTKPFNLNFKQPYRVNDPLRVADEFNSLLCFGIG